MKQRGDKGEKKIKAVCFFLFFCVFFFFERKPKYYSNCKLAAER